MTDKKSVSIHPKSFVDESLCNLSFEDAIKVGADRSSRIKPEDFRETSVRLCIDGLYRWLDDFSQDTEIASTFCLTRDFIWMWLDYCDNQAEWVELQRLHRRLTKEITHNSSYTDLVDELNKRSWIKSIGRSGRPTNVVIPVSGSKRLSRYCDASSVSFSHLYSLGMGWCLSQNSLGYYKSWTNDKVMPVLDEVNRLVADRRNKFLELENTYQFREGQRKKS
jgi:hypothetical protein